MDEHEGEPRDSVAAISVRMLRSVVDGATYEGVATEFGITRTAVERRVKGVAMRLSREVGIRGLNDDGTAFVRRLRDRREAVIAALEGFDLAAEPSTKVERAVSDAEIALAVMRIRGRSQLPARDVSMFYLLFVTGARPLEVARLRLRDYLAPDGRVRRESELPANASITGKPRPLYFASSKLDEALNVYLRERVEQCLGIGDPMIYRGLDPASPLFLTPMGEGFRITQYGSGGQRRFLCRPILETYRKLFRYAELEGATPLSVRRSIVARLYERGADEEQVGLVLGISDLSAVRGQFPRTKPALETLVVELV